VALTGHPHLDERSRREGFDHHFLKPADPHALLAVLVPPSSHGDVAAPRTTGDARLRFDAGNSISHARSPSGTL
jgi:hypothetical protein